MDRVSSVLRGVHKSMISGFSGFCGDILVTFSGVRAIVSFFREFLFLNCLRDITGMYPSLSAVSNGGTGILLLWTAGSAVVAVTLIGMDRLAVFPRGR